jgi:hypothetical protein
LHSKGKSIQFIRLAEEGPQIYSRADLLKLGYPKDTEEKEEDKKDAIYLVYRLAPQETEPEWNQYQWNTEMWTDDRGNRIAMPKTIRLSELIRKAGRN